MVPQYRYLTDSFVRRFKFTSSRHSHTVLFDLYDKSYTMDLEDFNTACKLPHWGNVSEPRKSEYKGPVWFSFYRQIPLPRSRIWTKGRTQQNPIPEIRCQNLNQKRKQPRTCFPKSDSVAGQNLKMLYHLVCQMTYIFFTSDFPQLFLHNRFFTAAFKNPEPNQTGL